MAVRRKSRIVIPQAKTSQDYIDEANNTNKISPKDDAIAISTPSEAVKIAYKSKHLNSSVMGSLSAAINKLKLSKDEVLKAMELFINQRTKTPEYIRIGNMLQFYATNLNSIERKNISYEELAEKFAIDHTLFIAAVAGGMFSVNLNLAKATLGAGMGEIVEAVVHRASQRKSGTLDAKLALQVSGLLDERTNINVGSVVNGNVANSTISGVVGDNTNIAPNIKNDIIQIDDLIRETYAEARKGDVIDAEVIEP